VLAYFVSEARTDVQACDVLWLRCRQVTCALEPIGLLTMSMGSKIRSA